MTALKIKGPSLDAGAPPQTGKAAAGQVSAPPFADSLKEARAAQLDGELKEILSKIRALGDRFFRSPDGEKLDAYKGGIKQYLHRIGQEMFSLRQETGTPKDGQQKVYQLVETINSELDDLTRKTLQQDKALQLLASLDDIRGLVLDLIT